MALSVSSFPVKEKTLGFSPVERPVLQDAGRSKPGFRAFFQKHPSTVSDGTGHSASGSSTCDSRHCINVLPHAIRTISRSRSKTEPSFSSNSAGADFGGPSRRPGWVDLDASGTQYSLSLPLYQRSKSKFLPQNGSHSQISTRSPDNSPRSMTQVKVTKDYATYPGASPPPRPGRHNVGANERLLPRIPTDPSSPSSDTSPLSSGSLITPMGSSRDPAIKMSPDSPPSSFNWQRRPLPSPPISRVLSTGPTHNRYKHHPRSASETIHTEHLPSPSKSAPIMNHHVVPVGKKSRRERPLPDIPFDNVSPTSPWPLVSPGPRSSSLNRIGHRNPSEQNVVGDKSFSSMGNSFQSDRRSTTDDITVGSADHVRRGRHARPNLSVSTLKSSSTNAKDKDIGDDDGADSDDTLSDQDDMSEGDLHEAWRGQIVVQAPRQWLASDALRGKPSRGRYAVPEPAPQHPSPSRAHERRHEPRPPGGVTSPETRPTLARRDGDTKTGIGGPRETRSPDDVLVVTARQPTSRGIVVWEERAVEDVIPKLRQLKLPAKKRN
jgi:hypothetical protein